jgi:hypothetical protein
LAGNRFHYPPVIFSEPIRFGGIQSQNSNEVILKSEWDAKSSSSELELTCHRVPKSRLGSELTIACRLAATHPLKRCPSAILLPRTRDAGSPTTCTATRSSQARSYKKNTQRDAGRKRRTCLAMTSQASLRLARLSSALDNS